MTIDDRLQTHTELDRRLGKRDPVTVPRVTDRVQYVIVQVHDSQNRAFHVIMVRALPVVSVFFFTDCPPAPQPLMRIFGPIIDNAESLVTGVNTREISVSK